jgi:hypothetical protein
LNRRRELYGRVGIAVAVLAIVGALALVVTDVIHVGGGDRPTLARADVTPDARGSASGATTLPARPCRAPLTADDPLRLWIGGDSLAGSLGPTLGTIAGATGVIQPYFDSRVSSGLTSPNFFDWPSHAETEMARLDPEVAVFIIGANDYPAPMQGVGTTSPGGSDATPSTAVDPDEPWNVDYAERVEEMYATLSKPGRTVIWVGPPSFKSERENAAVQLISYVSKDVIDRHPDAVFVDDYTLFLDTNGKYADRLPDRRGNLVTVRTGDGVHFTPDGAKRLASAVYDIIDAQCHTGTAAGTAAKQTIEAEGSTQIAPGSDTGQGTVSTTPPATTPATVAPATTAPPATAPPATTAAPVQTAPPPSTTQAPPQTQPTQPQPTQPTQPQPPVSVTTPTWTLPDIDWDDD